MTQDARVVLVASGGGTQLKAAWSDNPAASWGSTATAIMPTYNNGFGSSFIRVAYSPALNIAVAISNGTDNNNQNIVTSGDGGATWARRTYPSAGAGVWTLTDVCWCAGLGLFIIVGTAGPTSSSRIMTSPDGINWTTRTLPNTVVSLNGVCCGTISGSDYIVAVGTGNAFYTSTDGINWTSQTGPTTSQTWSSVCWNSGQSTFVACANGGGGANNIAYSTNGTSWTNASTGGSGYAWVRIGYSSDLNQMMVVGGNTGVFCYSAAGSITSWTQAFAGGNNFTDLCWSHDYTTWVLVGNGSLYTCATCNGTFTSQTQPNSNTWAGCCALPASTVSANNLGIDFATNGGYPYYNLLGAMSGFNGVSTHAMTINSSQTDEILVLFIEMEQLQATGAYAHVTSITGGPGGWAAYGSAYQYRGGRNGSSPYNYNTMEIWWTHATSVQSSASVTINTSASVDNLSASCMGVIGANTTAPFDTLGPFTNNGGSSSSATTPTSATNACSTTVGNELILAFSGAPRSISADYPPTGYTTYYMGGDASGADWGEQEVAYRQPAAALSAATVAFGGSYTVANWGMIVAAMVPPGLAAPSPSGVLATTEAKDVMAFTGGILGGTMGPTEAKDAMAFTGGVLGGSWHSTEADDTMSFTGHPELYGAWASTEAADLMHFASAPVGSWHSTEAADTFDGAGDLPPWGAWASTEGDDTFAGNGGVLGGSWHSTEAKDSMTFVGHPSLFGSWHSTEAIDTWAETTFFPPYGSWHSTEATDDWAAAGYLPPRGTWSSIEGTDAFVGTGDVKATFFDTSTASGGVDFQSQNLTIVNQQAFGGQVGAKSNTSRTSGKWYVEFTTRLNTNNSGVGIGNALADFTDWGNGTAGGPGIGPAANGAGIFAYDNGTIWVDGVWQSNWSGTSLNTWPSGSNVRVAIDLDNNLIWFSVNGGYWNGVAGANPAHGIASPRPPSNQPQAASGGYDISAITANGPIYLWAELVGAYDAVTMNAGASAFAYSVPSGFLAWDTAPETAIPLAMDGYATGHANGGPVTSGTVTLSTTQANDVIVLGVSTGGFWNAAMVDHVTSTSGLVWKRRNRRWQSGGYKDNEGHTYIDQGLDTEIWWAHAPLALSGEVITVHMVTDTDGGTGSISLLAFGVSGANYTTPWDAHTQAGGYVDNIGNYYYNPATSALYTKAANTFLFGFHSDTSSDTGTTLEPWTYVTSATATESAGYTSFLSLVYQTVETQQFNTNVVAGVNVAGIGDCFTAQNVMFDSIVAAGESGVANEIVWFWDPSGVNNVISLSTGTSLQLSYSPTNYNLMVLIEVAIMSASGTGEVTSISESAGKLSSTGFERRSRHTQHTPLGPLAVEIWWGWMPMYTKSDRPSNDLITINTIHCGPGDIIGAQILGLGGTTGSWGLGDPFWDVNPAVPSMNGNNSASPPPYTTDISTTIPSDLIVAWTANNTANVPGYTDPFVTLLQDYPRTINPTMQMNSVAPPFFTGFEFYYEPENAYNETAEFLQNPEPNGWIVIADAIPVGPPQPPSGTMHISDQQDKFTHTGDYSEIGIIGPGGWVVLPAIHGLMGAVEHEDKFTGAPAMAPWLGEGWLGWVPGFGTWASTDSDDDLDFYGWVLGFGITGQLHAVENKDRQAFSNRAVVTGTMGAVETKDRWASAGLVLPPGHIHPTTPRKRRLLIVT